MLTSIPSTEPRDEFVMPSEVGTARHKRLRTLMHLVRTQKRVLLLATQLLEAEMAEQGGDVHE